MGLDDICAKLSRNAEMTSREVDSYSPLYIDDDNDSVDGAMADNTVAVEKVDEQRRAVASGSTSLLPSQSVGVVNPKVLSIELVTSKAGERATSLIDSGYGEEDGDGIDDGGAAGAAGRRNRRKNFFPRCVQDGLAVAERTSELQQIADTDTAAASTTTWSAAGADVEDGQMVLDLRTGHGSSRQTIDSAEVRVRNRSTNSQDQILDLSIPRSARGPFGNNVQRDAVKSRTTGWTTGRSSSDEGELNSADMRVYAANTMNELLNIYGLPDEQQSAVADLRKLVPPPISSTDIGAPTLSGVDLRPGHFDGSSAVGRIQDMTTSLPPRHVPDYAVGQMQQHAPELTHVTGARCDGAYTLQVYCSICCFISTAITSAKEVVFLPRFSCHLFIHSYSFIFV